MTERTIRTLKRKRDGYIRKIQRNIREAYPKAEFDVSRGPGLRRAIIRVAVPIKDPFDVHEAVGSVWGDAVENNFHFYILPSTLRD